MKTTFLFIIGFALLTGCNMIEDRPSYTWDVGTSPHAVLENGSEDATWTDVVNTARMKWSRPLLALGCQDPFEGSDRQDVDLVSLADWPDPNAAAKINDAHIIVRGDSADWYVEHDPTYGIVTHELGHALGLIHVDPDVDPESVMHAAGGKSEPSALDIQNAAVMIGCR